MRYFIFYYTIRCSNYVPGRNWVTLASPSFPNHKLIDNAIREHNLLIRDATIHLLGFNEFTNHRDYEDFNKGAK